MKRNVRFGTAVFSAALAMTIAGYAQAAISLSYQSDGWDERPGTDVVSQTIDDGVTNTRGYTASRRIGQSFVVPSGVTQIQQASFMVHTPVEGATFTLNIWGGGFVDNTGTGPGTVAAQNAAFGAGSDQSTYYHWFDPASGEYSNDYDTTADGTAALLETGSFVVAGSLPTLTELVFSFPAIAVSPGDEIMFDFVTTETVGNTPWRFVRAPGASANQGGPMNTDGSGLIPNAGYSQDGFTYLATGTYFEQYRFTVNLADHAGDLIGGNEILAYQVLSTPEPASFGLLLAGGALMMLRRR